MMKCSKCGVENEGNAKFCEECGGKLKEKKEIKSNIKYITIGIAALVAVITLFLFFFIFKGDECKSPYIEFKNGECCLDANNNNICDSDETSKKIENEEIKEPQKTVKTKHPRDGIKFSNSPYLGDENASVVIVQFGEFEDRFTFKFYNETLPLIKNNYINDGKVLFVFKHFPLSFHFKAESAAEASECAREQDKFWEYYGKLLENRESLNEENYKKWAIELGFDELEFGNCYNSVRYENIIQNDINYGEELGISGTPTFFINGIRLVGAQPFESFKKIIEDELEG